MKQVYDYKALTWYKEDENICAKPDGLECAFFIRVEDGGVDLFVFKDYFEDLIFSARLRNIPQAKSVANEHYRNLLDKFHISI